MEFAAFRKQALAAKAEAEKEGIVVPLTLEDYCIKPKNKPSNQEPPVSNVMLMANSIVPQLESRYLLYLLNFLAISAGSNRLLR